MTTSTISRQLTAQAVGAALANWAVRHPVQLRQLIQRLEWVENGPAVAGYEPFFREHTRSPLEARLLAHAVRHCGMTVLMERTAERKLAGRLLAIARGGSTLVTSRRANKLRAECAQVGFVSEVLERACAASKLDTFPKLLEDASRRDARACAELRGAASVVMSRLIVPKGRRQRIQSVTHELFLAGIEGLEKAEAYTCAYDDISNEFTDPRTAATRGAFGLDQFDPRPARRRRLQARNPAT